MIYSIVIECFNITTEIDFSALKLALLKVFVNRIERVAERKCTVMLGLFVVCLVYFSEIAYEEKS